MADHRGWSAPEVSDRYHVVLVRRGVFRRMTRGRAAVSDPTMAYVGVPGEEERFAHPAGGDVCTSLSLTPGLWRTLTAAMPLHDGTGRHTRSATPTAKATALTAPAFYVDARLDLAHRRLLRAARDGDIAFALPETMTLLLRAALTPPGSRDAARTSNTGRIVDTAREAFAADIQETATLTSLAAHLGVSPYQLSRAFTRELGVSLTHYRNRVRVGRALDRLEEGAPSLAELAADLGFADQAHLTRTIRHHVGHTPHSLAPPPHDPPLPENLRPTAPARPVGVSRPRQLAGAVVASAV
ncbi:AraC family transcriptional regulator [Nonomuraea salmonea]|uniref:helix-turn-helix transcriptional regulator n=1 Tax=Nonomuraea salmonea TaxID=46181 RepID=UPI0031EAD0FD